jgi:hypothetical protein
VTHWNTFLDRCSTTYSLSSSPCFYAALFLLHCILTFGYLVFCSSTGAPTHLRGKEFIFRNGNHMHVKEFQDSVISHLRSIVEEGVSVVIAQNISSDHTLTDPKIAVIIMNSVKLMKTAAELSLRSMDSAATINRRPPSFPPVDRMNVEAANQVRMFQYSVPFTLTGRSHAKSIDEQWMRSTILTVKEPFPYILTRQQVQSREIRIYSPIEVAIYDIDERIEAMESELEKVVRNTSDCNNLMRIVQGTVMPQVSVTCTASLCLRAALVCSWCATHCANSQLQLDYDSYVFICVPCSDFVSAPVSHQR